VQIARPPDGFKITEYPAVTALITARSEQLPRLRAHWEAIKERLKFTGHRDPETVPVPGKPGFRLFVDDGEPSVGLPRVRVVYLVLGDTLTIERAEVGLAAV
jgi:hypothetical protein